VIKNREELLSHGNLEVREPLISIADATLENIKADRIVKEKIQMRGNALVIGDREFELNYKNIYVVGFGKASVPMAMEIERILGDKIGGGLINSPYPAKLERIEVNIASHPYPDERTLEASQKILEFLRGTGREDLVIVLISGGASSLFEVPVDNITIEEERDIIKRVMLGGANIIELNKVRIALSKVKGGGLLNYIYPAKCLSLIISDVIGHPKFVGSGPTYPQSYEVESILKKYGIEMKLPGRKTPKHMCENILLADNEYALQVAYNIAKSLGYSARISKKKLEGEPHRMAKKILDGMGNFRGIMIWGGETNVKVNGDGIGGRNQELALYLAKGIGDMKSGFLCMGTDGVDGPTDAAGGMVDGETIKRVWEKGIDLAHELKRHNSYEVLKKLGDLIITGYTGTNLADICLGVLQ